MNKELIDALSMLEEEKGISKEVLLDSIRQSLEQACKAHFGKSDNIDVSIDPETGDFKVEAQKEVVEKVNDPALEITLEDALHVDPEIELGGIVTVDVNSKDFGRIATQNAKNVILQRIREEERNAVFNQYNGKVHDIVTGQVQRRQGSGLLINLGKADALLTDNEQVKGENFKVGDRIRVYVIEVRNMTKGPKILVSRTHPELVRKLFESEVAEVSQGIVEIKNISREPGSRSKISVYSSDPDVDPVGACVGLNGTRVNAVVTELRGEKIDIVAWDENPAILIENALSPAKVISVLADQDEKSARVIVPDYQLSLAIGKEGQNARLAARLTGYKIDIKSESQARELGEFDEMLQPVVETEEDELEAAMSDIDLIAETGAAPAEHEEVENIEEIIEIGEDEELPLVDEDGVEIEYEYIEVEEDEDEPNEG